MRRSKFGTDWNKTGGDLYTGTAEAGKLYTEVTTVFGAIVCICFIILGVYLIRKPPVYTIQTTLTVTSVTPYTDTQPNKPPVTTYNILGTTPLCGTNTVSLLAYDQNASIGQTIPVWMMPNCTSTNARSSKDNNMMGWIFLGVGIVFLILAFGRLYLVKKSKAFAAFEGVSAANQMARRLFFG